MADYLVKTCLVCGRRVVRVTDGRWVGVGLARSFICMMSGAPHEVMPDLTNSEEVEQWLSA